MKNVVDEIIQLYLMLGQKNYGEKLTQLEHAVQCAELAVRAKSDTPLVCAALLHDIGHMLVDKTQDPESVSLKHDQLGANYLANYFAKEVTEPVRMHAQAKRYLCAIDDKYVDTLSIASLESLDYQGGVMSDQEATEFIAKPYAQDSIKLRMWDDKAKQEGFATKSIEYYKSYIELCLK